MAKARGRGAGGCILTCDALSPGAGGRMDKYIAGAETRHTHDTV